MYFYEGLSCPVCGMAFRDNEDVVACPQCGLPHHRACWKELGRCQMADKHGTDEQWSRIQVTQKAEPIQQVAEDVEGVNICSHCHTRNVEFAEFCKHCGSPLKVTEWKAEYATPVGEYTPFQSVHHTGEMYSDTERIGTATARELACFVGNNASYYIPQFRTLEAAKRCKWNWAAFLLGPFWLLYRKQYLTGTLLLLARTFFNVFGSYLLMPLTQATTLAEQETAMEAMVSNGLLMPIFIFSLVLLVLQVALALKGNALYKFHCESKILKARAQINDIRSAELASIGGTAIWVAVVAYFLSNLVTNMGLYFMIS